jgi:anhydro-N-acetylmuramic acid kinase
MFGTAFVDELLAEYGHLPADDLIATSTYFTAFSIWDAYEKFIFPKTDISEIIIGGGGSYNQTLVRMLKELLPVRDVFIQEELGFSSDAKEAVAFAILANETIHYQPANVPSATGAKGRVVLGSVTFPPSGIKAAIPLHENR